MTGWWKHCPADSSGSPGGGEARSGGQLRLPGVGGELTSSKMTTNTIFVGHPASEHAQHPGVTKGIGLDPLEIQELGYPLVIRTNELGVDIRLGGLAHNL